MFLPSFPENAIIPLVVYTKTVDVDQSRFDIVFNGVKKYDNFNTYLVATGITVSIILIILCILLYIKYNNLKKDENEKKAIVNDTDSSKKNLIR